MAMMPTGSAKEEMGRGYGILVIAFGLSTMVNLLRLAGPIFMILIYDRVLPSRSTETLLALLAIVVFLLLGQAVMDYARRRVLARFGAQFQERMEASLLASTGSRELYTPGRAKPVAGLDEVDELRGFFHSGSLTSIYDFVWTPLFLLVIFILHPYLGWVCAAGAVLIACLALLRMGTSTQRREAAAGASRRVLGLKLMLATSRDTIRGQDMSRGFNSRWTQARQEARDRAIALKDRTVWFDCLSDFALLIARYGVLAMGAYLTLNGQLTVGAMVAATFLVARVLSPFEKFFAELPNIFAARENWRALRDRISRLGEEGPSQATEPGNLRARLSLVNVATRSPLSGGAILKSITLDIAPGEIVQVIGLTGHGKTVLAETILGTWRRSGGTILVNGHNLDRIDAAETERIFGYVPDSPGFVPGTLAENIARLDPDATPEKVAAAARKACLHAIISALPDGYQTQIDASGAPLSRGQRHQLALARAVYYMPELLIFDEPDPLFVDLIHETVNKTFDQITKRGGSVLILSRKRQPFRQPSVCWQLEDGRLRPYRSGANSATPVKSVKLVVEAADSTKPADPAVTKLVRG
jgi:ABC-type protease/lipase transport system fused ATPase/permease subunit